jgi:hypothetical protein
MSCDTSKYGCGQVLASSCIPYTGTDLTVLSSPSLLACNANINDVITVLDSSIKKLMVSNDFTGLNVLCFTSLNPATVTAAQLHQAEITQICGLSASLTTLTNTVNSLNIGSMQIAIDLQCLTPAAAPCLTPPNLYSLLSILNVMISEICALKTAVGI